MMLSHTLFDFRYLCSDPHYFPPGHDTRMNIGSPLAACHNSSGEKLSPLDTIDTVSVTPFFSFCPGITHMQLITAVAKKNRCHNSSISSHTLEHVNTCNGVQYMIGMSDILGM